MKRACISNGLLASSGSEAFVAIKPLVFGARLSLGNLLFKLC